MKKKQCQCLSYYYYYYYYYFTCGIYVSQFLARCSHCHNINEVLYPFSLHGGLKILSSPSLLPRYC